MTASWWWTASRATGAISILSPAPRPTSTGSSGWDGVTEQLSRLYAQAPSRALPQGKARYANEALYLLVDAMDALYPEDPDEHAERSLARILDRIANASEIPAAVLAFELERLRAWRKAEADAASA